MSVVTFSPQYQPAFQALNEAWISQYFDLEPEDVAFLEDPYTHIIAKDGEIFVALEGKEVLGVCGIMKMDEGIYELVRMAVHDNAQGKGIGRALAETAIAWAKAKNAHSVIIETGSVLKNAVPFYIALGFEHYIPDPKHRSSLARPDVFMRLKIA